MYSSAIKNMIPDDEQGEDFWKEMSQLISIVMIQPNLQPSDDGVLIFANKNLGFDVFAIEFGSFGVVYP